MPSRTPATARHRRASPHLSSEYVDRIVSDVFSQRPVARRTDQHPRRPAGFTTRTPRRPPRADLPEQPLLTSDHLTSTLIPPNRKEKSFRNAVGVFTGVGSSGGSDAAPRPRASSRHPHHPASVARRHASRPRAADDSPGAHD